MLKILPGLSASFSFCLPSPMCVLIGSLLQKIQLFIPHLLSRADSIRHVSGP